MEKNKVETLIKSEIKKRIIEDRNKSNLVSEIQTNKSSQPSSKPKQEIEAKVENVEVGEEIEAVDAKYREFLKKKWSNLTKTEALKLLDELEKYRGKLNEETEKKA